MNTSFSLTIIIFFGIVIYCGIKIFKAHSAIREDIFSMHLSKYKPIL